MISKKNIRLRVQILGVTAILFSQLTTLQAAEFPLFDDKSANIIDRFALPKSNTFYYLILEEPHYDGDFYSHVLYRFDDKNTQELAEPEVENFQPILKFKLSAGYVDQFSNQFKADAENDRLVISLKPMSENLRDFEQEWIVKGDSVSLDAVTLNDNAFGQYSEIEYQLQNQPNSLCFTMNYTDGYGSTDTCFNKKTIAENYLVSKQNDLKEKRFLNTVTPLENHRYECKEDDGGCMSVTYDWKSANHLSISDFYPGGETLYEFFTQSNGITQTINSHHAD